MHDVTLSELDGQKEEEPEHPCAYELNYHSCKGTSKYWNELGCTCFDMRTCGMGCPDYEELDPRFICQCVSSEQLHYSLYPLGVTEEEIREVDEDARARWY